jgi:hypothetical protein
VKLSIQVTGKASTECSEDDPLYGIGAALSRKVFRAGFAASQDDIVG